MKMKVIKFFVTVLFIGMALINLNITVSKDDNLKLAVSPLVQNAKALVNNRVEVCYFCFQEGQVAWQCPSEQDSNCTFTTNCGYGVCD
ncbi:MAG: hypothetical protein EPN88_04995 [Bacteroidetes bacterium]|nr:MAG: hypothetical protein EPN88_04995 [Bacteroidota bacterium]